VRWLFLLLTSLPSLVWADAFCTNMQLQTAQTVIDFFVSPAVNPVFTVKANTNPGPCDFFITFSYGSSNSYNNRSLKMGSNTWPYQISKDSAGTVILKNFPDVNSNADVVTGYLTAGSNDRQVQVSYWALLNQSNAWLTYGNYSDSMTVNLYKGTLSSYTLVDSRSVALYYNAQKRVDISVTSSGGSFDIADTTETLNFGNLTSGTTRTCDVILKYNAGYVLYASSQNNGRLKHQTQSQYIPYSISFRGTTVNLAGSSTSPVQVSREMGRSPASGLVIPVSATIGTVNTSQSGLYKDTITLTVQSAE